MATDESAEQGAAAGGDLSSCTRFTNASSPLAASARVGGPSNGKRPPNVARAADPVVAGLRVLIERGYWLAAAKVAADDGTASDISLRTRASQAVHPPLASHDHSADSLSSLTASVHVRGPSRGLHPADTILPYKVLTDQNEVSPPATHGHFSLEGIGSGATDAFSLAARAHVRGPFSGKCHPDAMVPDAVLNDRNISFLTRSSHDVTQGPSASFMAAAVATSDIRPILMSQGTKIDNQGPDETSNAKSRARVVRSKANQTKENRDIEASKDRARLAKSRANQTEEKRDMEAAKSRARVARKRSQQTKREREERNATERERLRKKRQSLTPEELDRYKARNRERMREKRAKEKERLNDFMAAIDSVLSLDNDHVPRKCLTPDELEKRRTKSRERQRKKRRRDKERQRLGEFMVAIDLVLGSETDHGPAVMEWDE